MSPSKVLWHSSQSILKTAEEAHVSQGSLKDVRDCSPSPEGSGYQVSQMPLLHCLCNLYLEDKEG